VGGGREGVVAREKWGEGAGDEKWGRVRNWVGAKRGELVGMVKVGERLGGGGRVGGWGGEGKGGVEGG